MVITGYFTDSSLPEIFQFLEKGRKTGLLIVRPLPQSLATLPSISYIWVYQGHLVAAANRLDQQGLINLIEQHQWVSPRVLDKLVHWGCPISEPLGLYLQAQGVLSSSQLKQLFRKQVLRPVRFLSKLSQGRFEFEQKSTIPTREQTGLSLPAGALTELLGKAC